MIPLHERLMAALLAGACLSVLTIGALLAPSDAGHGTHEKLGLPRCGFLSITGQPCMTCGMTTSFAHAARAELAHSARVHPVGFLGVLATATTFWVALHAAAFGSQALRLASRLLTSRALWTVALLVGLGWIYKLATWEV